MKPSSITCMSKSTLALCSMFLLAAHGMGAEKDTLNSTDVEFVKRESAAGTAEAKIAALGVQKAERSDVKAFAETLVTDHTQANTALKALAEQKGVEVSAVINPKSADEFQKLEQASKADFDKEFLAAIVSDHKMCVSNFEDSVKDAKDSDVKLLAEKLLPTLKAHLAQAQELIDNASTKPTTSVTKDSDNTARNVRDRDGRTLTPLDQGNSQADVDTTAQIRKEIIAGQDMSVNAQNVKIITNTGKVTLRGPVNTLAEKRLIGEIADRVASAANVTNELEVKSAASN